MSGEVNEVTNLNPVDTALNEGASRLSAFWTSIIRTYAPKVVVAAIAWISLTFGFEVSADATIAITVTVVGLFEALWYFVARLFEQVGSRKEISWLVKLGGIMLFVPKPPAYTPAQAVKLIENQTPNN